jgi:membrane associated rhomboid family serine protease
LLIPLRHERMTGRRWPYFTFALIALNILIFLGTHWTIDSQFTQQYPTRIHLVLLAATHPDLQLSAEASEFVSKIKKTAGDSWDQLASPKRPAHDSWETGIRQIDDPQQLQAEMDNLSEEYEAQQKSSLLEHYAFIPDHPHAITYITANFLHGGWLHLIGNLWFLWLAGFILEDTWGRVIFPLFYLIVGAAALQFYAWCAPGSLVPLIGASGAVAGLMGAFLVRFPKLKIQMALFAFFFRFKFYAPAYWLLPLWLAMEFFYGSALGQSSPVAHWAHVGGFVFGMVGAFAIQRSGLEQQANEKIESKIGWTSAPDIVQANELIEQGKLEAAVALLDKHLATHPATFEALHLLQQIHWRRNDTASYFKAMIRLLEFQLKSQDFDGAWQSYEEYSNSGGNPMPAVLWLEMIRSQENQNHLERAVEEYERLATALPMEKQSLLALLSAGRICLKNLNRPEQALKFYNAAAASVIPHAEWDSNIRSGMQAAEQACGVSAHR